MNQQLPRNTWTVFFSRNFRYYVVCLTFFPDTLGILTLFNNNLYSVIMYLSHSILITTLRVRYYYYFYYIGKETETQIGQFVQDHTAREWWSQNSKPNNLAPDSVTLTTLRIPLALDLNTVEVTLEMKHQSPPKSFKLLTVYPVALMATGAYSRGWKGLILGIRVGRKGGFQGYQQQEYICFLVHCIFFP